MTNTEIHRHMEKLEGKIDSLVDVVTPLVTKIAVVEEKQANTPKTNALWAGLGVLAGIVISLLTYILRLPIP